MSCANCEDIRKKDKVRPPCLKGGDVPGQTACWLPPLSPEETRVMRLAEKMMALGRHGAGGEILRMHGATREDLDLLVVIEEEVRESVDDG